jgi:hypothetical protein
VPIASVRGLSRRVGYSIPTVPQLSGITAFVSPGARFGILLPRLMAETPLQYSSLLSRRSMSSRI